MPTLRQALYLLTLLLALGAPLPAHAEEASPHAIEHPAWFKNSFLDLREDLAEADKAGKRLLLYFHQDGCPYCKELIQVNFADRAIVAKTRKHFDVIAINIWGDREVTGLDGKAGSEKQFAAAMKVQFTPTLIFLDEKGKTALRLNGFYPPRKFSAALDYVSGRLEGKTSFADYLKNVGSTAPSTGLFHEEPFFMAPPYLLQRNVIAAKKPLAVFFEQKFCTGCDEMHAIPLKEAETRQLLDKFDVVRLNLFGKTPLITPDGKKLNEGEWGRALKVAYTPTIVFFDEKGKEVFRVEAFLKTFHLQSSLDYVASGAYKTQPNFQRFVQARADALRAKGVEVDLWK
jgi:thioredoxin-related protein